MSLKYYFILARTEANGIGYKGTLPWNLRNEMKYFQKMTTDVLDDKKKNAVIMGKRTWESMPNGFKPLSKRLNIVISSTKLTVPGVVHCFNLQEVDDYLKSQNSIETAWVIGGSVVYESAIAQGFCNRVYVTEIYKNFPCDTFVNLDLTQGFKEISDPRVPTGVQEENDVKYEFKVFEKL